MCHGEKLPRMESYTFLHYFKEINSLFVQADIAYGMIFQSVDQMQNSIGSDNFYLEKEKVWMFIMTFLALSGNVSKLLFPVKRDGKLAIRRGKELRRMIKVDERSIISDRKLRDDFEHFDARLDAYFQSDRKHTLIDKNIGDPSEYAGVELREFLRHFYPEENMIIFSGKEYDLKMMMDELITINTRVKEKIFPRFQIDPMKD